MPAVKRSLMQINHRIKAVDKVMLGRAASSVDRQHPRRADALRRRRIPAGFAQD
jgi:hypothetical protein